MWSLNLASRLSLYKQTIHLIEKNIASGKLAPGERLPAERTLAGLLGVNRSTVIHALDDLAERGVLVRKRGSGTYVNSEKWGVQNYAMLNWRGPSAVVPGKREAAFHRVAAIMREEAERYKARFDDLSGDGLPPDLLPEIAIPRHTWEDTVAAEKGDGAARLGLASLRRSVRAFLRETHGMDVPLEEILITSGSRQAVFLITQCMLKPGDAVGVEAPSYFYSLPVFQAAGLRLFALPMDGKGVSVAGLESVVRRRSLKMIFLNPVFHNPTGAVMQDMRKKAVLAFCAKARIPIMEDDAYSLLSFSPARNLSPIKAYDQRNQVIYAGSLSSYAGGNLRAGWLVAPSSVINKLADVRLMMDAGLSVLPQVLAAEYLDHRAPEHLPKVRAALAGRAANLVERVRSLFGGALDVSVPQGGLYCYAVMNRSGEEAYASVQRDFLRHGMLPALGEAFGDARGAFRLNHGFYGA